MRALVLIALIVGPFAIAEQAPARRPLTHREAAALEQPLALLRRVVAAWSRHSDVTHVSSPVSPGVGLFTDTPTLELLHATRSLSDSDLAASLHYRVRLHHVPRNAPASSPLITMRTDHGELIFDVSGDITLESPK